MSPDEEDRLKRDLIGLFGQLNRMRHELAELQAPVDGPGDFDYMADTLEAIVENTEQASNTIMESMEAIEDILVDIRAEGNEKVKALCDRISMHSGAVFESCSFQDLTGQRINRVATSLKFIEQRINSMVRMWGRNEVDKLVQQVRERANNPDKDKALLHGPQRQGVAISQADIDQMMGGGTKAAPAAPAPAVAKPAAAVAAVAVAATVAAASSGGGSSQADIDALFDAPAPKPASQADIDALFDAPAPKPASQADIDALFDAPAPKPASQADIDALFDAPAPKPTSQADIDALFDAPAPKPASQADIDALFDAPAKPAAPATSVSQDDIDAMFSQDDVDKMFNQSDIDALFG